jgi:hypothetical protein
MAPRLLAKTIGIRAESNSPQRRRSRRPVGIPKFRNMCYGRAVARSNGWQDVASNLWFLAPRKGSLVQAALALATGRGARIKVSAKFAHNQLKRLISDERIQENPRKSNPHKRGFSHQNGGEPRKPKQGDLPHVAAQSREKEAKRPHRPAGSLKAPCATRWKSRRRTKASFRDGRAWPNRRSTVQESNREARCRSRR